MSGRINGSIGCEKIAQYDLYIKPTAPPVRRSHSKHHLLLGPIVASFFHSRADSDCADYSAMSTSSAEVIYSPIAQLKIWHRKRDEDTLCEPHSTRQSDPDRWRKHHQNRSENMFSVLQYYWVFSLVGLAILYRCSLIPRLWYELRLTTLHSNARGTICCRTLSV